jgi:hypothetical protein
MKNLFTILLMTCLTSSAWAAILTVCPNNSYPAKYTTIQSANDSASPGDTIYVYPANYQTVTNINKRLVIIGPGLDPHRPVRLTASIIQPFTLVGTACSGSIIMGITFTREVYSGTYNVDVNNISFIECRFNNSVQLSGNNILVENCILFSAYSVSNSSISFISTNAYGNIIQNSYLHGTISLREGSNTIIRNNVFASGDANNNAFQDVYNIPSYGPAVQIINNIFYKISPATAANSTYDCAFKNNIYYLTNRPIPTNLLSSGNLNVDPLFVNFPAAGDGFSFGYDYHLQSSSPGVKYGTDGNDVGIWGGLVPVNAGYEPPIPRITELKLSNSTVPAGGTLQLTIKATKAL